MSYDTQFPNLSSFLIFTSQPISHQQKNTSDPDALPPSVLYFFHSNPLLSPGKRNRLIGLAQGLLNFSSVLGHGLHPAQSSHPGLRVIHSANQKMIFLHPEAGFHLCAVIKLPQANQPAQGASKLPNTLNILSQQPSPPSSYQPSETVLLNSLHLAAQEYRLLNGSLTSIYSRDCERLVKQLERFWSVWLWRWNVGKTGCGAVDFNELFGHLESPSLEPPRLPERTMDSFNQFISHTCPEYQALPILICNHNILHLPSPTESVKQEEIQTLARYLLSLLGGSEAKPIAKQTHPPSSVANGDQDSGSKSNYTKNLSGLTFNTVLNFAPKIRSFSQSFDSKSSWAHKALSWASTSLVMPPNSSDNNASDIDSLDQRLRADLGLLTKTPPNVVSIKSVPSNPQLSTDSVPSPTPLTFKASRHHHDFRQVCQNHFADHFAQPFSSKNRHTVGYPGNLEQIYPPKKIKSESLYYPENLKNLYNNNPSEEYRSNSSESLYQPRGQQRAESSRRTISEDGNQIFKTSPSLSSINSRHTPPLSSIDSKHDPRSSDFNVEYALADAMSEYSIGNIASLEGAPKKQPYQEFLAATTSLSHFLLNKASGSDLASGGRTLLTPPTSTNDSTIKHIKIYVNEGEFETDVVWIRHEDWNMALIMDHSNHHDQQTLAEKDGQSGFMVEQSSLVLKSFVESGWLPSDESLQEATTPSTLAILKKNPTSPTNPRYLIRNVRTGIFLKQSSDKSSWLLKNQIWPGKIVHPFEVEVSHALLSLFLESKSVLNHADRGDEEINRTIKEGFLRTNSGQWVIFKKINLHRRRLLPEEEIGSASDDEFELFLVLPSGSGTLLEADNALRILEQRCEEIKFSLWSFLFLSSLKTVR